MDYEKEYKSAKMRCEWQLANGLISEECATDLFRDIDIKESEDERIRKRIIAYFKACTLHKDIVDEFVSWLEKQKEQKPAEWSEKDEGLIDLAVAAVEDFYDERNPIRVEIINRLKSLRPQPHWKPSVDQIGALNSIILNGSFTYVGQVQDLISLKDELKKL